MLLFLLLLLLPAFSRFPNKQKDLQRRLRHLWTVLQTDDRIEPDSPEWPGLAAVATCCIQWMNQRHDASIRLLATACCLEILCIYAPTVPWDDQVILQLFVQLNRHLANLPNIVLLAGTTTTTTTSSSLTTTTTTSSTTHTHTTSDYPIYLGMLEKLAHFEVGCVLTRMAVEGDDAAGEVLQDFVHTCLHAVRREHTTQLVDLVQEAVAVCLEYYANHHIPIKLLEELLLAIGQGPSQPVTRLVERKGKMIPTSVPEFNPTYRVAAMIIRKQADRLATPLASLLNALVNGDTMVMEQTTIPHLAEDTEQDDVPDVYTIIFHLHSVAPIVLTTVLGTVASHLLSPSVPIRVASTKLLGKLLVHSPTLRDEYPAIYRAWWQRKMDAQTPVRQSVVHYGARVLGLPSQASLEQQSNRQLQTKRRKQHTGGGVDTTTTTSSYTYGADTFDDDANGEATQAFVHLITQDPNKAIRLAAIEQVCEQYLMTSRKNNNTDVAPRSVALPVLQAIAARLPAKYPTERQEAVNALARMYSKLYMEPLLDSTTEPLLMLQQHLTTRRRVSDKSARGDERAALFEWIPSRILACLSYTDEQDTTMRNIVINIIDNVLIHPRFSPDLRAAGWILIQNSLDDSRFLGAYFRQRARLQAKVMEYIQSRSALRQADIEQSLRADATARDILQAIAALVPGGTPEVLEKFHTARDQHIFRLVAAMADPKHSAATRTRVMEDLPRRCHTLGEPVVEWVKTFIGRCVMGSSVEASTVHACLSLAQEALVGEDTMMATQMLSAVQLIAECFPSICAPKWDLLAQMLQENTDSDIVTHLTNILAHTASTGKVDWSKHDKAVITERLLDLSTKSGTPEQARNAAQVLARISVDEHATVLQLLTSPSRLIGNTVSTLSALTALANVAPGLMTSVRGKKAIKYALETVLLGRGEDDEDADSETESSKKTPSRRSERKHETPSHASKLLQAENISQPCKRMCAAIEFITCYVRSSILESRANDKQHGLDSDLVERFVEILTQIQVDKGIPVAHRNHCRTRQDRAALRYSASLNLLRLCEGRLHIEKNVAIEKKFLTPKMWQVLSESLLDEERVVREALLEELESFLQGTGLYGTDEWNVPAASPPLRFLALITLCADSDHGSSHENGHAANVGRASSIKAAAVHCIVNLRKTCDATYAQCRALGDAGEKRFESHYKMMLMPEYAVPYAIHILANRNETPTVYSDHEREIDDGSGRLKLLRRRLKLLFEPLIRSLGESADNISFLLRMIEVIGRNFRPIDLSQMTLGSVNSMDSPVDADGIQLNSTETKKSLEEKLTTVCATARDVLFTFIKKDVNLTPYPGGFNLPRSLFERMARPASGHTYRDSSLAKSDMNSSRLMTPVPKSVLMDHQGNLTHREIEAPLQDSALKNSRVHFSPDVVQTKVSSRRRSARITEKPNFGNVSPIARSTSPASALQDTRTLGTTPPSALRGATIHSTQQDGSTTSEDPSSLQSSNSRRRTTKSRKSPLVVREIIETAAAHVADEDFKTTSETQSQGTSDKDKTSKGSRPSRGARSSFSIGASYSLRKGGKADVPVEIKIPKEGQRKRSRDGHLETKNQPVRRTLRSRKS